MKTLYVTDLDGTLLTSQEHVSAYSCERLNALTDRGMILSFATARSALSAKLSLSGLKIRTPVVLYNGGLVYDYETERTLRAVLFTDEEKRYVHSILKEFDIPPFVFGARCKERERVAYEVGKETLGIERYLYRRRGDVRLDPVSSEEALLEGYIFYFKCICPREQLEKAWNILKYDSRFICIFHQEKYQNDFWMEISPREATKANGVRFLKEYLGCDKVVCFGDTSNDSDMFDVCDEKYAVMNADSWLKEKATGVAKWLEANFNG